MLKSVFETSLIITVLLVSSIVSHASLTGVGANSNELQHPQNSIPLYFTENNGQVDERVKYFSKTPDFTLWLSENGFVFDKNELSPFSRNKINRDVSQLVF
jgi:hypothetical protein